MRIYSPFPLLLVGVCLLISGACSDSTNVKFGTDQSDASASDVDDSITDSVDDGSDNDATVECENDQDATNEVVWLCINGMAWANCVASVEAALNRMDCLVTFSVSLEESGATVEYLNDYVSSQNIADHVEAETAFDVTCQDPVEQ